MSHQTGIRANEELKKFFGKCRDGKIRVMKIAIENEQLSLLSYKEKKGNWESDYEKFVPGLVEAAQPTFILFRLDTKSDTTAYDWLLISWSPDDSPVRQKMLYASTKATLKQEFGSGQISEELHATVEDDVTLRGLTKSRVCATSPAPLSMREEEMASLSNTLADVGIGIDSRTQTLGGVAFPVEPKAVAAIQNLKMKRINYVRLKIDLSNEEILLDHVGQVSVGGLPSLVPSQTARYHLFNFKHTHEEDVLESIVFIYSMPGDCCSVKEKMLYSSCKAPLLETITSSIGLQIEKRLEIDNGSELTEDYLQDELHPKKCLHRPKFDKPKGPPNRGARRITKDSEKSRHCTVS
ncbi:twinfilin isoform X2 [Nilaparvata lugens]|uniref:twinfilin isoform X2 n=1 Tax=Nilaparvata lugens TaxID=108931 RepID=UPI00193E3979|nr:twinfilin isoform X2 [Nilaparvata lugens]